MNNRVLAFDIGGTSVKYAEISECGEVRNKASFRTKEKKDLGSFLEEMLGVVEEKWQEGIRKVGISSLGIFDKSGLCLGGVENLAFLEQVNLPEEIRMRFPDVECHIKNDGVAAAVGEHWLGEGRGCDNFICMTLGTGIGGAIVIDGKPVTGSHFQSGEIGYSNYRSEQDYMELHYSMKGVLRRTAQLMGVEKVGGVEFVEKVKAGETTCCKMFEEWMEALAHMLANSMLLLDPEKIIIGGGVSGEKKWLCDAIEAHLRKKLPPTFRDKVCVKVAKNGNDAGLLGAVVEFFC